MQDLSTDCIFVSTQDASKLRELSERSRSVVSFQAFKDDFLKKQLSGEFKKLQEKWGNCTEEQAYDALKRVFIRSIDSDTLARDTDSLLAKIVDGNPESVRLHLVDFAVEKIHHTLTAFDIWNFLEKKGFYRLELGKNPHVLARIKEVNDNYAHSLREDHIAGEVIQRDEVLEAVQKITSADERCGVLICGEAGVGKSGVISQVLNNLHINKIPFLAFRVDTLSPVETVDLIGRQLNLPGSPVKVLANIAQGRDCVLVIDQLDAVSLASGRNTQFFDRISKLIEQSKSHPNIRLLLACRKFDLDNDPRIKSLTGKNGVVSTVEVSKLPRSAIREIVQHLGIQSQQLDERQIEILSLPLHLRLLAEVAEDLRPDNLQFQTAKDLYDRFWKYKRVKVRERLGPLNQWTQILQILCRYMNERQTLAIPESYLDEVSDVAQVMASEHVLRLEQRQYRFFHESFFDYTFARQFATSGQTLCGMLNSGEQHLFRRAQVRQILLHQREVDFEQYLQDLEEILFSQGIRTHLKSVTYALLATLSDPREAEWEIISRSRLEPSNIHPEKFWMILHSSVEWFQLIDSLGMIKEWLFGQDEALIDKVLILLSSKQNYIPDRIAEIAEFYIHHASPSVERMRLLLRFAKLEKGRRFFELFLSLIDSGIFDNFEYELHSEEDFWWRIYDLPNKQSGWACEGISRYLNRCLEASLIKSGSGSIGEDLKTLLQKSFHETSLRKCAKNTSRLFVESTFSFLLRAVELSKIKETRQNRIWYFVSSYGRGLGFAREFLNCFEIALCTLSANNPKFFLDFAEDNLRDSKSETLQYLLVQAYTANGKEFANLAIESLLNGSLSLRIGHHQCDGNINVASHWAIRLLLEAVTPHCSTENLIAIESLLLDYYPKWEKSKDARRWRGYTQYALLDSLDSSRRSDLASHRLEEWIRKFSPNQLLEKQEEESESAHSAAAYLVGAPIPKAASEKMTDEQWLKAIERYEDYDDAGLRFEKTTRLTGGARQISQQLLQPEVLKEPIRFARLVLEFPDYTNTFYFTGILYGLAELDKDGQPKIDAENALKACQRCHQLPQHPCGRAICYLVSKLSDLPWNHEIYEIISWYALYGDDPAESEPVDRVAASRNSRGDRDIAFEGINSTRGGAASAIASLIFSDCSRAEYFLPTLQKMLADPSLAVRAFVVEALLATLNYDRDIAVSLFLELQNTEIALLGTQTVERFLKYGLYSHLPDLTPVLEKMLASDVPGVIEAGARQSCIAAVYDDAATPLVELCLSGTQSTQTHRLAAAEIFKVAVRSAYCRDFCERSLVQLFNDPDSKVRSKAAECFFDMEKELREHLELMERFIETPAFSDNSHDLLECLVKTSLELPGSTYRACERLVQSITREEAQSSRSFLRDVSSVSQLIVRLYSQNSKDRKMQARCLDLIDQMIEVGTYGCEQSLSKFER
ncbi:MAG: ATP-binding protein [Coleofasciculaceae cyanobacterium RL_1_1]|nr:ATP-binding protein [Coleofasciculaceae cyanobacterium RL_1_1]